MSRFVACVAGVVALSAASVWSQVTPSSAPPLTLQVKPPASAENIAAVVGDEKISGTELDGMVDNQLRGQAVPPEAMPGIRKAILESMIQNRLVVQFVAAKGIKADAADVEQAIASIKKQLADAQVDLAEILKKQGLTEQTMRQRVAAEMAVEKYAKAEVTEPKAEEYFKSHTREFDGTEVKASHILLKYEPDSPAEEKKAANDKIAAIRQQVAGGADFAAAAKQHSACPSSAQGGDLGFFPRHGKMVEPFAAAAFALAPGGISQPVETQFGIHLIKVTEVKPGQRKFEEAKGEVLGTLYQQLLEKAAEEQRKVSKVEILN